MLHTVCPCLSWSLSHKMGIQYLILNFRCWTDLCLLKKQHLVHTNTWPMCTHASTPPVLFIGLRPLASLLYWMMGAALYGFELHLLTKGVNVKLQVLEGKEEWSDWSGPLIFRQVSAVVLNKLPSRCQILVKLQPQPTCVHTPSGGFLLLHMMMYHDSCFLSSGFTWNRILLGDSDLSLFWLQSGDSEAGYI